MQPARRPSAIFLDDGNVLNDNAVRGEEWKRLIGEFMPPCLGGTPEAWATANRSVFPRVWGDVLANLSRFPDHATFYHRYVTEWMRAMCLEVGVEALPDDAAAPLYREMAVYVAHRAVADIPGAIEAVRALHGAGYALYMASGTASWELDGIVARMGLDGVFQRLYGPDLVEVVKYGPAFYERIFADCAINPADALVIDSDLECCEFARQAGAPALWVDARGRGDAASLVELLPRLI